MLGCTPPSLLPRYAPPPLSPPLLFSLPPPPLPPPLPPVSTSISHLLSVPPSILFLSSPLFSDSSTCNYAQIPHIPQIPQIPHIPQIPQIPQIPHIPGTMHSTAHLLPTAFQHGLNPPAQATNPRRLQSPFFSEALISPGEAKAASEAMIAGLRLDGLDLLEADSMRIVEGHREEAREKLRRAQADAERVVLGSAWRSGGSVKCLVVTLKHIRRAEGLLLKRGGGRGGKGMSRLDALVRCDFHFLPLCMHPTLSTSFSDSSFPLAQPHPFNFSACQDQAGNFVPRAKFYPGP